MLQDNDKTIILLDALDESTTRNDVLSWIRDVVSSPKLIHVQLILTSRSESEFTQFLPRHIGEQNCLALNKEAVNADVRSYVAKRLQNDEGFIDKALSANLLQQIAEKIGDGADGM